MKTVAEATMKIAPQHISGSNEADAGRNPYSDEPQQHHILLTYRLHSTNTAKHSALERR
ncbi:hypothetical protein PEC301296_03100 [Pectobacterium carotovorum subsp. carotovorum]|nr:hypothetical protein GZ59_26980 [Pectobacterium atrosepticum]POW27692.1 hypothetical protein PB72LOC_02601 [Pectobacterium atrosepticum]GKV83998.1 hypothetical protein PEC301296_03100 [Pectobacterium carotovorum subsp. carotovorum]